MASSTGFYPSAYKCAQTSAFSNNQFLYTLLLSQISLSLLSLLVLFKNSYSPLQFNPLQAGFCTQHSSEIIAAEISVSLRALGDNELNQLWLEDTEMGFLGKDVNGSQD